MYYPYFRGKQFELITIRETAVMLARSGFVPIIEPVRESLKGLERALEAIRDHDARAIVVVNPYHGDHRDDGTDISKLLDDRFPAGGPIAAGILLDQNISIEDALAFHKEHEGRAATFIHVGFAEAKSLPERLGDALAQIPNVFFEAHCGRLYRDHFVNSPRILLRDGFKRRRNADYPPVEDFSDLHITYPAEGMVGFGDFLIVGDDYNEGGGPAYAVAIHLTFIDPDRDHTMRIYHFVSKTIGTPTDPAGKFAEALKKLVTKLDSGTSKLLETSAIREFRELHARGHFPGLGYVKKLSMNHHIETLADYFNR
jgi:hypothetical protein